MTAFNATVEQVKPTATAKITIGGKLSEDQLLDKINELPWVLSATIKKSSGRYHKGRRKKLTITTMDFVVDTKGGRRNHLPLGTKHYINGLILTVDMNIRGNRIFLEEVAEIRGTAMGRNIHPHVGGSVCWGSGNTPMTDAVRRGDYLSLVHMFGTWALNPNYSDALRTEFPITNLPVGWIITDKLPRIVRRKNRLTRWFRNLRKRV